MTTQAPETQKLILIAMMTPGTPEYEELGDKMEAALAELDEGLPPATDSNLLNTRMTW